MRYLLPLLVFALLVPAAAAPGEYKTANQTDVEMIPPAGFAPVTHFKGFQNVAKKSSLMVETLPYPVAQYRESTTQAAMARRGGKLLSKTDVKSDLGDAFLCHIEQTARGQVWRKWMFYLGDAKGAFRVSGVYPVELEKEMSPILEAAVQTARRAGSVAKIETKARPFTLKPEKPLKLARKDPSGQRIYAENGRYPMASAGDYLLIAAPSRSTAGVADRKQYAIDRIKKYEGVRDVKVGRAKKLRIDGLEAWEVTATATFKQNGTKLTLFETIVFDDVQYYIMMGSAGVDRTKAALKVFRKTVKSFRREKLAEK
jgi:hypothetical protein